MQHFHVGQHVVMLKDAYERETFDNLARINRYRRLGFVFPVPSTVYVVRAVLVVPGYDGLAILLEEIRNPYDPCAPKGLETLEPPFPTRWFRPLQKLKVEDFVGQIEPVSA